MIAAPLALKKKKLKIIQFVFILYLNIKKKTIDFWLKLINWSSNQL